MKLIFSIALIIFSLDIQAQNLKDDPVQNFITNNPIKTKITSKIILVEEKGLKVELGENVFGYIKKSNLSKDKNQQKTDRFAIGEKIDSIINSIDSKTRMINLSIKELEIQDEKEALSKYGSSDSGASLGDILGSVLNKKN